MVDSTEPLCLVSIRRPLVSLYEQDFDLDVSLYEPLLAGSVHPPTSTETGSLMLVISSIQNEPLP
jgi:hypothetical protein